MRVLFVVPYTPSLIRVRPYQLIRGLARRGHKVSVATLWTSRTDFEQIEMWRAEGFEVTACRMPGLNSILNCISALPTTVPLQSVFSWSRQLSGQLLSLLERSRFDVIHVEHVRGAKYGLFLKERASQRSAAHGYVPVVFDSVDCISNLFRQARAQSRSLKGRLLTSLELGRTERFESRLMSIFDRTVATSEIDTKALQDVAVAHGDANPAPVSVVSNGVDLEYFSPNYGPRDPATIVFSGKMSYHANVTAAKHLVHDIMPLVWANRPDVKLVLAGADPPREVRVLESVNRHGSNKTVVVTGSIKDLRPYLWQASMSVAPVPYGAGIQNKVLEAMSCAAPVVASPQAVSALQCSVGCEVLLGNSPQAFAEQMLMLLGSCSLRERIGRAGRIYVETFHTWESAVSSLERVYLEAIQSARIDAHDLLETKH